ncbi:MAG: response regulator [Candidatus Eisenbacteria bacterium]|uniref:Response regulator n=1 Tax=Eiseniibacteriota bacterium TaxID=2212470 RepID=A0A956SGI8_UNCEI|nr:response regulator [Candidatus Eisenbacteria bacterium]
MPPLPSNLQHAREPVPTILVVDDQPAFRSVLREQLEADGYHVLEAGDGAEAMRILTRGEIDVAVIDIFMPGVDGIELLRAMRKERLSTKVIAMSGGGEVLPGGPWLELACHLGAVTALSKPFDLEVLSDWVSHCLRVQPRRHPRGLRSGGR